MASNVLDDEERFITIIDSAINAGDVKSYPQWKKDVKDARGREKRKQAAKGEAAEAEELAKELGVHDKLFGNGHSESKTKGKGNGKGKGKKQGGKAFNEDGVDEDALKQLIQSRNSKNSTMNSLIEKLEAKYGVADSDPLEDGSHKRGKGKTVKGAKGGVAEGKKKAGGKAEPAEPTDEEFEALQKKLFGGKGSTSSSSSSKRAGGNNDDGADDADAPNAKRTKRSSKKA